MLQFTFRKIEKQRTSAGAGSFPTDCLRLRNKTLSISRSFAPQLGVVTTSNERTNVRIGFEVDTGNKAIRVYPDAAGFTCAVSPGGHMIMNVPTTLKRLSLPQADYRLVDREAGIFVLAQ